MGKFTPGTILDGRKVVTVAGTAEALSIDKTETTTVVIQAETDNSGVVCVGDDTVIASQATRRGVALNAADSLTLSLTNLYLIYIDATVSGDGVTFTAEAV